MYGFLGIGGYILERTATHALHLICVASILYLAVVLYHRQLPPDCVLSSVSTRMAWGFQTDIDISKMPPITHHDFRRRVFLTHYTCEPRRGLEFFLSLQRQLKSAGITRGGSG